MTERLYEQDAYLQECEARIVASSADGVVLDRTVFYARGGGQPGDSGVLLRPSGETVRVVDAVKGAGAGQGTEVLHVLEEGAALPPVGETLTARIDWDRRHRHMRMHTCLHLLCAVVDAPVTGGNLNDEKGRLDFDLPESTVDKAALTDALNALIDRRIDTAIESITDDALAANPSLVKTMSVQPPTGAGTVRLLRIGDVDLQPCGGTHVANIGEIGPVRVSRIEKKSRLNRRISLVFDEA